ncbi:MAG: hypothetical protein ACE5OR_14780 [bacterium]
MRSRQALFWFLVFAFSLALAGSVSAWMVKIPLENLVKEADYIVVGKVTEMRSAWDADGRWIRTYVTISVDRLIKGPSLRREFVISYIGGVVGQIGLWLSDTPAFKPGQHVLVFLQPDGRGTFKVTGRYQGKFTVEENRIVEQNAAADAFLKRIKTIMKSQ